MLTIRREQIDPLEAIVRGTSERALAGHLAEFAPEIAERLGADRILELVREGVKKAAHCGFNNYGPVRFYLELMFSYGWFFNEDPQFPWASVTLGTASLEDQMVRAERLFERMSDYREEVHGPGNAHVVDALEKLRDFGFEAFFVAGDTFEASVESALKQIYPQRCAYMGGERLSELVHGATASARRYSLSSRTGVVALAELMIFFGARVVEDPLYAWVGDALGEAEAGGSKARTDEFHARTKKFIERVAGYWRPGAEEPPKEVLLPGSPLAAEAAWSPFGRSERKPMTISITSEAAATVPANRWRTKIGVGEAVNLAVSKGSAQWTLSGAGQLSVARGHSVVFTAADHPGDVTVNATSCGAVASIAFTVVAPSGLHLEPEAGEESGPPRGTREAGFRGRIYLLPADVSFHGLEVREQEAAAVASGAYTPWNGLLRQAGSSFLTTGPAVESKGTPVNCVEDVCSGDPGGKPPFEKGSLVFEIPWEYRVGAGSPAVFATVPQRQVIDRNGRVEINKGEVTETNG